MANARHLAPTPCSAGYRFDIHQFRHADFLQFLMKVGPQCLLHNGGNRRVHARGDASGECCVEECRIDQQRENLWVAVK